MTNKDANSAAPDQTNAEVSDERLRELEFCPFCSGEVTHVESWAKSFKPPILYIEYHHDCAMFPHRVWSFPASSELNSAFVAAWNRRSVTSQASEGDGRTMSGETVMGMPVTAYMEETEFGGKFATHWSTIPDHRNPIRLFAEPDVRERLASAPVSKRVERLETERDEAVAMADAYKTLLYSDEVFVGTHWEGDFRDPATKAWPTLCAHFPNYGSDAEEIPPDQILTVAQLVRDHGSDAILAWACHHRGVNDVVKGHLSAKAREIFQALQGGRS